MKKVLITEIICDILEIQLNLKYNLSVHHQIMFIIYLCVVCHKYVSIPQFRLPYDYMQGQSDHDNY